MVPSLSARLRSDCDVPPLLSFEPTDTTDEGNAFHLQRREGDLFRAAEMQIQWLLTDAIERNKCDELYTIVDVRRISPHLSIAVENVLERIETSEDETAHTLRALMEGQKRLQWDGLLELPLRHAARETLLLHSNTQPSEGQIDSYLEHHAASTLETIECYMLPDLQKRLAEQQMHCAKQRRRLDMMSKTNSEAFEQFDEFCCRTIGVSTDEMPLFPGIDNGSNDRGLDRILEDYASRIGECALSSMKKQLNDQVARYLLLLSGVSDSKCYGKDLMRSLVYFHLYGEFISSLLRDGSGSEDKLSTLEYALARSCDQAFVLEFATCPARLIDNGGRRAIGIALRPQHIIGDVLGMNRCHGRRHRATRGGHGGARLSLSSLCRPSRPSSTGCCSRAANAPSDLRPGEK